MSNSNLRTGNAKILFGFILVVGFVLVGFYNYTLIKHTNKLENIVTFLEAQKLKVVDSIGENVTIKVSQNGIDSLRGMDTRLDSGKSINLRTFLEPCAVNLSTADWKLRYTIKANDVRNDSVLSKVRYGGLYKPDNCKAKAKVAIIVSYRDRKEHLEIFLYYMHAFLQRQQLEYGIYVVELALPTQFNRGLLSNVGFSTAKSIAEYDCYIFHDVDLLPKYIYNSYTCFDQPTHYATRNMKYHFKLPYEKYIGGVFGIRPEAFERVNGFSNLYFGWGREDDDFRERIFAEGYEIYSPSGKAGTYIALPHTHDTSNPENPARLELYKEGYKRFRHDGLNSMMYTRLALEFRELYTWIYVQASEVDIVMDYQNWKKRQPPQKDPNDAVSD